MGVGGTDSNCDAEVRGGGGREGGGREGRVGRGGGVRGVRLECKGGAGEMGGVEGLRGGVGGGGAPGWWGGGGEALRGVGARREVGLRVGEGLMPRGGGGCWTG